MRFEAANITSIVTATANTPMAALRAPATEQCKLRELGIFLLSATSTILGICRATTVSVTPGTTVAGQNKSPGGPASGSLIAATFGTAPVLTSPIYFRSVALPAAIGAGIIWTWPADDPLIVGNGTAIGELVLANFVSVAPGTLRIYAVWED